MQQNCFVIISRKFSIPIRKQDRDAFSHGHLTAAFTDDSLGVLRQQQRPLKEVRRTSNQRKTERAQEKDKESDSVSE